MHEPPAGDRFFEVLGHRLAFETRGADDAPTAVCLHGLTGDRRLLADALDDTLGHAGLRRLHLDLPGHGASMGNPLAAGADELVAAVAALLRAEAGPRPLLIGHSYGGYLAQALLGEVEVGALCLICPVVEADAGKRTRPPRRIATRDDGLAFADDHERETFEEVVVRQTAEVLAAYRRQIVPGSIAADRVFIDAVRARYSLARPYMHALGAFAGPATIVCGRDDHWVGFEDAVRLARALGRSSLHVMAEAGHLLPLEEPERLRALVNDWLARWRTAR